MMDEGDVSHRDVMIHRYASVPGSNVCIGPQDPKPIQMQVACIRKCIQTLRIGGSQLFFAQGTFFLLSKNTSHLL
jgi:hypothetical protein